MLGFTSKNEPQLREGIRTLGTGRLVASGTHEKQGDPTKALLKDARGLTSKISADNGAALCVAESLHDGGLDVNRIEQGDDALGVACGRNPQNAHGAVGEASWVNA